MKRKFTIAFLTFFGLFLFANAVPAQKPQEPVVQRDPVLEADAMRNLEVSRHYFRLKKAYKASLLRLEETIAANPNFSRMDEVLYMAGMSSFYLSEGRGKQKIDAKTDEERAKYAPERLREDAVAYLNILVEKYPQSEYRNDAEKALRTINAKK